LDHGLSAAEAGSTEMHIVGRLHHQKDHDWYLNIVRILHDAGATTPEIRSVDAITTLIREAGGNGGVPPALHSELRSPSNPCIP